MVFGAIVIGTAVLIAALVINSIKIENEGLKYLEEQRRTQKWNWD